MSVLINESFANPTTSLWVPATAPSAASTPMFKFALQPFLATGSLALTGGVVSLATIALPQPCNLAEGSGYVYFSPITTNLGGAQALNIWLAEGPASGINSSLDVAYISAPITTGAPLVVDLSKLRHYDAAQFGEVCLNIQSIGGNMQCTVTSGIVCCETTWTGTTSTSNLATLGTTSAIQSRCGFVTAWAV